MKISSVFEKAFLYLRSKHHHTSQAWAVHWAIILGSNLRYRGALYFILFFSLIFQVNRLQPVNQICNWLGGQRF
jgi:hypothetical protein